MAISSTKRRDAMALGNGITDCGKAGDGADSGSAKMGLPAFKHVSLKGGVDLHVLETRRFKTVLIEAVISEDLSGNASMTALLPAVLRRGTAAFADMQEMARHLDNLYGASFGADVLKIGERLMPYFRMEFPSPALVDPSANLLAEAVDFMAEVMLKPRIENGGFVSEFVEGEKANLISQIRSLVTDYDHYAAQKCIEHMCLGERFAFYEYGTVEDAERITPGALYDYYRGLVRTKPMDVYAVGDLDAGALAAEIGKAFRRKGYSPVSLMDTEFIRTASSEKTFFEEMPIEQARLAVGFRTGVRYADPNLTALVFYNGIFGGFAFSKLFKIVREREGLAYFAGSQLERTKGIMLATTGIDAANFDRVMELVRGIVGSMADGDISEEEMESARARLMSRFNSTADSQTALINMHLEGMVNRHHVDVADVLEAIGNVTVGDVVSVARGVKMDTAFLLRPKTGADGPSRRQPGGCGGP